MSVMNKVLTKERWEELINGKLYSTSMQDGFMYLFKTDDTPKRIYLHLAHYFFPTEEIEIKNRDFQTAKEEIAKHIETYYMEIGKCFAKKLKNEFRLDENPRRIEKKGDE